MELDRHPNEACYRVGKCLAGYYRPVNEAEGWFRAKLKRSKVTSNESTSAGANIHPTRM